MRTTPFYLAANVAGVTSTTKECVVRSARGTGGYRHRDWQDKVDDAVEANGTQCEPERLWKPVGPVLRECLQVIKRWMASLAWSWKDGLARSGKMSAWSTKGPVIVLAALP